MFQGKKWTATCAKRTVTHFKHPMECCQVASNYNYKFASRFDSEERIHIEKGLYICKFTSQSTLLDLSTGR